MTNTPINRTPPQAGVKLRGAEKMARIPIKIEPLTRVAKKPDWIRVRAPTSAKVQELKAVLREHNLVTVCEEATCPNLGECFGKGTATFMIMGAVCTRRCSFCDVAHGRPLALDKNEPTNLAKVIADMKLNYVVITSVDRDDLRDGGAGHFVDCIQAVRERTPNTKIEILVPDFRGRAEKALGILRKAPPDVFNHNVETAPRLYKQARPGSDYQVSLDLIKQFKAEHPNIPSKSGIMVGLGETDEEVLEVMQNLHDHHCEMLTIGQYLQPSRHHLPVERFVHPEQFKVYEQQGLKMGFKQVASGPLVRSSYHADQQAAELVR